MKTYRNEHKDMIAYPLGGMGAGMICLNGNGSLGSFSLRHRPQLKNNPTVFSALHVKGLENGTKVIEAPVPKRAYFDAENAGNGLTGTCYGLPRFDQGAFSARFPFAKLSLKDHAFPIKVDLIGWSPFIPNDEDRSSLPYAALEYTFINPSDLAYDLVYSFNAFNPVKLNDDSGVEPLENGIHFTQNAALGKAHQEAHFMISASESAQIDAAWFRGAWFDPMTMVWKNLTEGKVLHQTHPNGEPASSGASLFVPFHLKAHSKKTITIQLSWYVPYSEVRTGEALDPFDPAQAYRPWYTSIFSDALSTHQRWLKDYASLRKDSQAFSDAFHRSTIDPVYLEAASANLSILKSPTVLRQQDGRLWAWEGCCDHWGCCDGSCTHVWNYAQSICHLFPKLERGLRETEGFVHQDPLTGHQNFRVLLPIRFPSHQGHSAADGQLGGLIKLYREWRYSGDTAWMSRLYPSARQSLDFAIAQWDPAHSGLITEPHHNTYDIEFWGAEPMNSGYYLGALKAMSLMSQALNLPHQEYDRLYQKGREAFMTLYNGEYFHQKTQWEGLRNKLDPEKENKETQALIALEGPKYQYGTGCLSDALVGIWLSELSGLSDLIDHEALISTLRSIMKHNFKPSLKDHANPQRPGYACADEAGLLLCTWPKGHKPSLPFVYSDEIWTGIEYQVASHLLMKGESEAAKTIVRALRQRYDGTLRNPYSEYECGQWYARAMASYALIEAASGFHYDGLTQTLSLKETQKKETYFLITPNGFGNVIVKGRSVQLKSVKGTLDIKAFDFR